jgi:hypothetical protein
MAARSSHPYRPYLKTTQAYNANLNIMNVITSLNVKRWFSVNNEFVDSDERELWLYLLQPTETVWSDDAIGLLH